MTFDPDQTPLFQSKNQATLPAIGGEQR